MKTENTISTSEAQIREFINNRVSAIRKKDLNAVLSEYAPDVVIYSLAPPLQTEGADSKALERWFSSYRGAIECEIRDLTIFAGEDIAFCHFLYRITGTMMTGQQEDMWVRGTLGFQKKDGEWLIVHQHDSEPFDMHTFNALLDLKP
jgi:uncharacterized protein (TIGR02246 family)